MLTLDTIGKGLTFGIADDDINVLLSYPAVKERIVRIGLSNILKDSHASITAEKYPDEKAQRDAAMAMVQKTYQAMMTGEVRKASVAKAPKDPVMAEAMRLARVVIIPASDNAEQMREWTASFNIETGTMTPAEYTKAIVAEATARYAKTDDIMTQARERVAAQQAIVAKAKTTTLIKL